MSWLSDAESSVLNKPAFDRFMKVVGGLGIDKDILNGLPDFIEGMRNIVSTDVSINVEDSHSSLISQAQMIRVFYNLVMQKEGSPAGLEFERYLALLFGGYVVPATQDKGDENIADVIFGEGDTLVSLKMLQKGGKIKGSIRNLIKTLKLHGDAVIYIVCAKPSEQDPVVRFHQFTFTLENIKNLPGVAGKAVEELLAHWEPAIKDFGPEVKSLKPGMQIKLNSLVTGDFQGGQIGSDLDLSTAMEKTQMILEAVNVKFNGLLLQLQELVKDVDDLTYSATDKDQTKKKAASTKKSAEKTDAAAGGLKSQIEK